jgi:hypothetical protein
MTTSSSTPRLSTLLMIPDPPFVDVRPEQDNRVFIDPSAIRASAAAGHNFAKTADKTLRTFFGYVAAASQSGHAADQAHGARLLTHLREPNQTRLGMSRNGHRGKGMADGKGADLWRTIRDHEVCSASAVPRLEHVPLFVPGMGSDLMSDAVTQIVWPVLVAFTHEMRTSFPSLAEITVTTEKHQYFNRSKADWDLDDFDLPYMAGRQLLLVPREFVSKRLIMNHGQFYRREALEDIVEQRTSTSPQSRKRILKKNLKEEFPDMRATNLKQALEARTRDEDLVADYEQFTDRRFVVMTHEDVVLTILSRLP